MKRRIVLLSVLTAVLAGGGGYWLGQQGSGLPQAPSIAAVSEAVARPEAQGIRQLLYYQDPDGKPDCSPAPKKSGDGRDYVAVYDDAAPAPAAAPPANSTSAAGKGRALYYRNPMGLPDTSPTPKKDSMGMDYIPVYQDEATDAGIVSINPGRLQTLGVRTASVETRATLTRSVRATGTVQLDERHLAAVTTKVEGWVERLEVAATGDAVKRGQVLAWLYSPDLVAAEQEYLVAAGMGRASHGEGAQGEGSHGDPNALMAASARRLRALDVPEDEIARLRRTGEATRRVAVRAPANGIVTDKAAVEGMRVAPGEPLYRTADLSTVWLVAEVQEGELGAIQPGQHAAASFVAFPGRTFDGTVDFIYPVLNRETRTGRVRIVVPNHDLALRGEMYASVVIETPGAPGAEAILAVPESAVIDSGPKQIVLVERGEGRFEPRPVRLGMRGDGYAQVLDGVKPGERVVVGANFLIDAESNLRAALQAFAAPNESGNQGGVR
jgi:Cu(I)/Ag(I) efflux system membrane fusion protein